MAKASRRRIRTRPNSPTSAAPVIPTGIDYLRSEDIERDLITGENARLLQQYFGEQLYEELRRLAIESSRALVRGAPRVLILPGLMGSTLGIPGTPWDDVIWVDPADVVRGRLIELRLGTTKSPVTSLGIIPLVYLRLKFSLRRSGFDADFFHYDWRKSIWESGRNLAARIRSEPHPNLSLVAHSMGGLVARAACHEVGERVKRVVMLGTPNHGSFVPVQAFQGVYPLLQRVARFDLQHSARELAEQVFTTHPGLCQLLPSSEKFSALDLFQASAWPASAVHPPQRLLTEAREAQTRLSAVTHPGLMLIAGVNQTTLVGLRVESGDFVERYSAAGDGTVPLDLAQLSGVPTYYAEESHGSLQNNARVARAIVDLLDTGATQELPDRWSVPRQPATWEVRQADLRATSVEPRNLNDASLPELRELLREVAAPPQIAHLPASVNREAEPTVVPSSVPSHPISNVVVGRQRQFRLDLRMVQGSIAQVDCRAIVLGIFRDVAPTGAALALDDALGGAVRDFMQRRMYNGNVGEVFLMPTGRHPIRSELVGFVGLGSFDRLNDSVLQIAAENTIRTLIRTRVEEVATVAVGAGSGQDVGRALENQLIGLLRGLKDVDQAHRFRGITICELDPQRFQLIRQEIYRIASTPLFDDVEVTFYEEALPEPLPTVRQAERPRDPVYLIVREEPFPQRTATGIHSTALRFAGERPRETSDRRLYRSSVLTAGPKATVISEVQEVRDNRLAKLLANFQRDQFSLRDVDTWGAEIAKVLLTPATLKILATMRDRHLVIVLDALASRIPWETIRFDDFSPAATRGMSRRYLAENISVAKWLEQRQMGARLEVLMIINPTEDLPLAREEGDRLRTLFADQPSIGLTELREKEATHPRVMEALQSGRFDVVHYAGHAFFDERNRSRSGIICAGDRVLSGAQLAGLSHLPALVFFNACEAARVRGRGPRKKLSLQQQVDRNVSLAEAYLRGGIANYLGTYWPVGDSAAGAFALEFYKQLVRGTPVGEALCAGRAAVREQGSADWADYIHYGDHEFRLKIR